MFAHGLMTKGAKSSAAMILAQLILDILASAPVVKLWQVRLYFFMLYLSIHRSRVTQIKLTIVDSENIWRPQGGKPLSEPMMYYCNLNLWVDLSDVLIKIRSLYKNAFENKENVFILMKFLSPAALEVVILITYSAASDTNFVKITFSFQWMSI